MTTRAELAERIERLRIRGISRMWGNKKALLLSMDNEPTDDDMRAVHDFLALRAPALPSEEEIAKALAAANNTPWTSLMSTNPLGSLDGALGTKPFWMRQARAVLALFEREHKNV